MADDHELLVVHVAPGDDSLQRKLGAVGDQHEGMLQVLADSLVANAAAARSHECARSR